MRGWTIDPEKLRELREEAQLTPTELAARAGCHRTTYYRVERGIQLISASNVWAFLNELSDQLGRKITVADIATPRERTRRKPATANTNADPDENAA